MNFFLRLFSLRFRKRSYLRKLIRGYAQLRKKGRIGLGREVKSALVDCRLPNINEAISQFYFGSKTLDVERIVHQYLFERHIGTAMNRAILYALGNKSAVCFGLPAVWQRVLVEHGLNVSTVRSTIIWMLSILRYFCRNVLSILQMFLRILTSQAYPLPQGRYVYFDGLSSGNMPKPDQNGQSYDICSWYAQWDGRAENIQAICHGVEQKAPNVGGLRVEWAPAPYLLLRDWIAIFRLFLWSCAASLLAMFDLLRGRWWHALLLAESVRAKAVALCPTNVLAVDYLFHFSGTIYRPLWTYEAERKGARIICYFYSTFEQAKLVTGYQSQKFEWGAASWPLYLVWDFYQEAQLRRDLGGEPEIRVVGPIWFSCAKLEIDIPCDSIAVFDVEAHRLSSHFPFTTAAEYIAANPEFSERFLKDVEEAISQSNLTLVFKKKRDIGLRGSKRYSKTIQEFSAKPCVMVIPSNVSALQIIEKTKAIISMPFTSTALYMRDQQKPSIYYDPFGWVQKDDRAAHGITILTNKEELTQWVNTLAISVQ